MSDSALPMIRRAQRYLRTVQATAEEDGWVMAWRVAEELGVETRRDLLPVLAQLREDGYLDYRKEDGYLAGRYRVARLGEELLARPAERFSSEPAPLREILA